MTCSPARLAANKANSLKSKGPVSDFGKAISRKSTLTHGLTAKVLRTREEDAALMAAGPLADWLKGEVILLTVRIDRAHQVEDRERDRAAIRAERCWDEDRAAEAARIGRGLARNPERAVSRLRDSVQGCEWLIARWKLLLAAAGEGGVWNDEQCNQAFDLQGIPLLFRRPQAEIADSAGLAGSEIVALEKLRDAMRPSDQFERETTQMGLDDGATPELRRVIRHESTLHRRLHWCLTQIQIQTQNQNQNHKAKRSAALSSPAPMPVAPAPVPPPKPATTAPPSPQPQLSIDEEFALADLDPRFDVLRSFYPDTMSARTVPVTIVPRRLAQ